MFCIINISCKHLKTCRPMYLYNSMPGVSRAYFDFTTRGQHSYTLRERDHDKDQCITRPWSSHFIRRYVEFAWVGEKVCAGEGTWLTIVIATTHFSFIFFIIIMLIIIIIIIINCIIVIIIILYNQFRMIIILCIWQTELLSEDGLTTAGLALAMTRTNQT